MNELSDQQLVKNCLAGDREAFGGLVLRYQDSVYGLAVGMTHNREDAADMAQEAFIRAYDKLDQYNPAYTFKYWLLRICANQTKNLFRKRARCRKAEENHLKEGGDCCGGVEEQFERLEAALACLSPRFSAPLRLKHMEGMTYDEISSVLGIGVSAAKMRTSRGRKELAELLRYEQG